MGNKLWPGINKTQSQAWADDLLEQVHQYLRDPGGWGFTPEQDWVRRAGLVALLYQRYAKRLETALAEAETRNETAARLIWAFVASYINATHDWPLDNEAPVRCIVVPEFRAAITWLGANPEAFNWGELRKLSERYTALGSLVLPNRPVGMSVGSDNTETG